MPSVIPFIKSQSKVRVGINGFGRIGRNVFRVLYERPDEFEVVAVNDLTDDAMIEYLLKYDSTFGRFRGTIDPGQPKGGFSVDGRRVAVYAERDPAAIPWSKHQVDIVLDSTGVFRNKKSLRAHVESGGARKVVLSAPSKGEIDATVVMGVNHETLTSDDIYVSNASCTTNCLAPMAQLLHENFGGIVKGAMTTIHAYTNDQRILDLPHSDPRRARAAAVNMIPTSTGAASAVGLVLPELAGKLHGISVRVPVPDGSLVDLTVELGQTVDAEAVNDAFRAASEGSLGAVIHFTEQPLVSSDIVGDPHSCVFDSQSTSVIQGNMLKVLGWYDNEWGYSNRVADLMAHMSNLG